MARDLGPVGSKAAKLHARVNLEGVAKVPDHCSLALPARRLSFGGRTAPSKTFSTMPNTAFCDQCKGSNFDDVMVGGCNFQPLFPVLKVWQSPTLTVCHVGTGKAGDLQFPQVLGPAPR